jgi:cyclic beta-1,2-glucan synthetase
MVWLPYAVAQYVAKIGDTGVLDELEHYLHDEPLRSDEHDRYNAPPPSAARGSLYEHCCRALDHSLERIGDRGLPLMGTGDWNDGMNLVGQAGRGQSIWLGWFLAATLRGFAPWCRDRGDGERADRYEAKAVGLAAAIDRTAWDGRWYVRAFTDDGHTIGASSNEECRIDSIAQSWAVICGLGNPERARRAVTSADETLLRRSDQLCLLLAPPFDRSLIDPGYIKGYVPGARENGGHYSHAACWMALAHALLGDGKGAVEIWRMISPVNRSANTVDADRYRIEPYVVAGDIYGMPPHAGRGGWTWYTGAAGWLYRVAIEAILGLKLLGGKFRVEPCIPPEWSEFTIAYRHYSSRYVIRVINPQHVSQGVLRVELDGEVLPPEAEEMIVMADDGREHQVLVVLGT